jgi:LAO/AO transport system kinase
MSDYRTYKPEWTPKNAGDEFAGNVMVGVDPTAINAKRKDVQPPFQSRKLYTVDDYVRGILECDRMILARAITIIESNAPKHFAMGQEIVQRILPYTGKAARVGITGVPGAGKSTFIEALGNRLCDMGQKIAVLAVDPSSTISKGSILGDKTRMTALSKRKEAFIRPSPSGGTLGGVTRKSRETLLLCEAAGFDTILVETVGVGQSETTVRSMVDFFLVLVITGAGDDLQGIKKGIIETADAILVNKADGDNLQRAKIARAEYEQVLHYLRPATDGWVTKAYTCSAITGEGIEEIWGVVLDFISSMEKRGSLAARRQQQTLAWVKHMTEEYIRNKILNHPSVMSCLIEVEEKIRTDNMSATMAAKNLIETIETTMRES